MNDKIELDVGDEVKVTGARHQPWLWSAGTYRVEGSDGEKYRLRHTVSTHVTCHFFREQLTLVKDARQDSHPPSE